MFNERRHGHLLRIGKFEFRVLWVRRFLLYFMLTSEYILYGSSIDDYCKWWISYYSMNVEESVGLLFSFHSIILFSVHIAILAIKQIVLLIALLSTEWNCFCCVIFWIIITIIIIIIFFECLHPAALCWIRHD